LGDGPLTQAQARQVTPQAGKILADWLAEERIRRVSPEIQPLQLGRHRTE
jgi:primosomal protein N' (replication factor Y)